MEINTQYLNLKINGEEHKLEMLTYEQTENILEKIENVEDAKPKEALKVKGETLISSGITPETLKKLQMAHVNDIFNALIGGGKN